MPFVIAVIILIILSVFFFGLRAYMGFCALMIGIGAFISGLGDGEDMFLYIGIACLIYAFLSAYLSVRGHEKSQRPTQMFRFFIYGLLLFIKVIMIAMIITIPLAKMFNVFLADYRETIVVDELGREVGKVYVDKNNRSPDGKQYDPYDPY